MIASDQTGAAREASDTASDALTPACVCGHRIAIILAATLALLASGCPRPHLVARPYPPPPAARLREALLARQRLVTSMNARARATSWLGGDRVRATVMMLVDRPGRLRFEAEVSLQGTVAVLATDGRRFAFLDTMKNELRRGPACPANVASLIRIPLGPADVAAILLGDLRLPPARGGGATESQDTVDWDPARAADVLAVRRADGWLRILMQDANNAAATAGSSHQDPRILGAIATGPDGRPRWRVAFEDFVTIEAADPGGGPARQVALPQTIRFAEGDTSFDEGVEIKFRQRSVNESAAAEAFELASVPNAVTIEVGCP
ncbi:MAG: hypothetical protein ABJA82_10300 [Myxococcales bacterium]